MGIASTNRKEFADISAKTGKNVLTGAATASMKSIATRAFGAAVVGNAGAAALTVAAWAPLSVIAGEWAGRKVAEACLPKEYQGRLDPEFEAAGAVAQDAKWLAGKAMEVTLNHINPAGVVASPWVEAAAKSMRLGEKWDSFVGIEGHQASAHTAAQDLGASMKSGFMDRLEAMRAAKRNPEPEVQLGHLMVP